MGAGAGVIGAGAMGAGGETCVGKDGCIGVVIGPAPIDGATGVSRGSARLAEQLP